ncbi:MAG TPA: hypothetical protein VIT24_10160 [Acidimicrobiales bacterium]
MEVQDRRGLALGLLAIPVLDALVLTLLVRSFQVVIGNGGFFGEAPSDPSSGDTLTWLAFLGAIGAAIVVPYVLFHRLAGMAKGDSALATFLGQLVLGSLVAVAFVA